MPAKRRKATRMTPGFTGPFKGEPQQGTLFDKRALDQLPGNVEATRNRPGPRGYSLARLGEVRSAWESANVYNFQTVTDPDTGKKRTVPKGIGPVHVEVGVDMNQMGHYFGPSHYDPHADPAGPIANRARSRMLDTLARSSVDFSQPDENVLGGLGHVRTYSRPPYSRHAAGEYASEGTAGHAEPSLRPAWRGGNEPTRRPTVSLYAHELDDYGHPKGSVAADKGKDPRAEQTFLHELGHHESWQLASESSRYETKAQQATEEARADKFAVTHFRPDPRNKEPYDPREHTYMARGLGSSHFSSHADWYRQGLPADMRPPPKKNRNVNERQFEQQTLANPFFFGRHLGQY